MMKEEKVITMNRRFMAFICDMGAAFFLASCVAFPLFSFSVSRSMLLSVVEYSAYINLLHRLLMMMSKYGVRSVWELYFDITPVSSHRAQVIGRDLFISYNLWVISSNPNWILFIPLFLMSLPLRINQLSPLLLDLAFRIHYVRPDINRIYRHDV